jgi:amylosucrase
MHFSITQKIQQLTTLAKMEIDKKDKSFYGRFIANAQSIATLYTEIYGDYLEKEEDITNLLQTIVSAYTSRRETLKEKDTLKLQQGNWFLSNQIVGMSLYVDRFCGTLKELPNRLHYLKTLGVNFLHLMPLMESPAKESDGGYAVSDFRKVAARFGTNEDLIAVQQKMEEQEMYLMLDIVLNHTSHQHAWAKKAKEGDTNYQDFFYTYPDRTIPDALDSTMPEIFPESSPGSFTYNVEMEKWVMTVFHQYQWDLNYTNPKVLIVMLDTIFYYANLGVDILRIDAPAFIWKQLGTACQNLPQAHTLLRLIKLAVQVATPGMALLGEAIVAPKEIIKYFGTDKYLAKECDVAYAATNMALQWDALATGDTKIMLASQYDILQKPIGTTWITYTRCHDDIGLGYEDEKINSAGYQPYDHRKYIKEFYSGTHAYSTATGALFSVNPKTQDARISGTLASLCGLEKALESNDTMAIQTAINRIIMMQAQTIFIGGIPMLFYGDEVGYTNDYSYLEDDGKSYDNRWMHRPLIDWRKNELHQIKNSIEERIFTATQNLIAIRKKIAVFSDYNNIEWMTPHNIHIAGFVRSNGAKKVICLFNYSNKEAFLTWYAFKEKGITGSIYNHCNQITYTIGNDAAYLILQPYQYAVFEPITA